MRYIKVPLYSGVTYDGDFHFNFDQSEPDEIISLTKVELYKSTIFDHVYFYGYSFNDNVPSDIRTKFIHQLKGLSEKKFDDIDFKRFLTVPIAKLGKKLLKYNTIIYPVSQRSEINKIILKYVRAYSLIDSKNVFQLELIKNLPQNIKFDFDAFEQDNSGEEKYIKWKKKASKLIQKINNSNEYFSLAKTVPSPYRRYICNFLKFNKDYKFLYENIHNKNILLLDDINTSSSTLIECIKAIKRVAVPKSIVIFTLLGKSYASLI